MRVGILTLFHGNNNWGGDLQGYALKAYIEDNFKDANVDLIKYRSGVNVIYKSKFEQMEQYGPSEVIKKISERIVKRKTPADGLLKKRNELFEQFQKCYLTNDHVYTDEELSELAKEYDCLICGLKKELSLLDSLYSDIKKEEQSLKEASRKASRRKTLMEQELKNLKGEKMRMYEEYAAGTLSLDNYKSKKLECDRKIAEVQDKIEQFKAEESVKSVVPGTVRAAAEQAENFLHGTRLTASMVSAFIENVYVHEGGRIVVRFKYEQSIQDAVRALHTE